MALKKKAYSGATADNVRGTLAKGVYVLGRIIRIVIDLIGKIIKPLLILVALALMLAFTISWILSIIGLFYAAPFLNFIVPGTSWLPILAVGNILFLIGIPVVVLIIFLLRPIYKTRLNSYWQVGLWVLWFLNLSSLAMGGIFMAKQFSAGGKMSETPLPTAVESDTLHISSIANPYEEVWTNVADDLKMVGKDLVSSDIRLSIVKGEQENFELHTEYYSRGETLQEANMLAEQTEYDVEIVENEILLPSHFMLVQGRKWRGQHVNLFLKVPVGKSIKINRELRSLIWNVDGDRGPETPSLWQYHDRIWTMTEEGLICPSCTEEKQ